MPRTARKRPPGSLPPAALARLADDDLLEAVQRQCFRYFWEGAHPASGLAPDRRTHARSAPATIWSPVGGSGFGIMALIVAVERGWVTRDARARCASPHARAADPRHLLSRRVSAFHARQDRRRRFPSCARTTAATWSRPRCCSWACCARASTSIARTPREAQLRNADQRICGTRSNGPGTPASGRDVLSWHWSPTNGWALDLEHTRVERVPDHLRARGRRAPLPDRSARVSPGLRRGDAISTTASSYYGIQLPLGAALRRAAVLRALFVLRPRPARPAGPLCRLLAAEPESCAHQSRALRASIRIGHKGYGAACWGLTSSDDVHGYAEHSPNNDTGTISPTAAVSSMPYTPRESLAAVRHFLAVHGARVWGRYGFVDAFCEHRDWFARHLSRDRPGTRSSS